ncbi:choice-of-anchor I family protein [Edaphocola aurantiacus]|uniref:choice-of-anchor I family protein n=1 Tax=Edaphocola aurantiacus TaxID=2601682 RepID=UPI001C964C3E|nr:choice-of-anchor I family protein [Edaphocola aurantiacus]
MNKILTRSVVLAAVSCMSGVSLFAQTNITQWNFNSPTPDNNTGTGTMSPSLGTGTMAATGGTAASFASGASNGGSSDPATADNSGLGLTTFPTQGTANKTAGITFSASTAGYQNIRLTFDQRHSNTGPAHMQLQYTLNASVANPVWVDVDTASAQSGDVWNSRSFNLSAITGLNNNATAGFRVVAAFAPSSTAYNASSSTGTYGTGGTWRFDMVTVKGDPVTTSPLPNLVITEIIHSPNDIEMIEVYNAGTTAADLTGLYFTNGTTGNFPAQMLPAGGKVMFATNTTSAASLLGGGTYNLLGAGLGSTSDILVIKNASGAIVDSVAYQVGTAGWPATPAGTYYGYSIELNNAALDNNVGANWTATTQNIVSSASGPIWATPGVYPPPAPNPAPVVTSFRQNSATSTSVKFNQAVTAASATNTSHYVLNPALAVTAATLSGTDSVVLTHAPLVDGTAYTLAINGVVNANGIANVADTADLIWNQSSPNLVITEIIHSPNNMEMIEVYNAGTTTAALGGLKWAEGTSGNFPVMNLPAGANVVFSTSPNTADTILNVPVIYMLGAGLSSSDDILVIRNSLNQTVDSVHYYAGTNGWPASPAGLYGFSYELTVATLDNNVGANWIVPVNEVNPAPAGGTVRATPGVYPAPAVTPVSGIINFVGSAVAVNEQQLELKIVANIVGGIANPAAVDIELIPGGTATSGTDFTMPANLTFNWPAGANNVNDTITVTIANDNIPENAEYFAVRFANPVNVTLPAASANLFTAFILDDDKHAPVATKSDFLNHVTSYQNHTAGDNSAEIVAYDKQSKRLFIANSIGGKIDIVDFHNPANPVAVNSISINPTYGNINSVATKNGIVVAAVEDLVPENPGKAVFFDTNGVFIKSVTVGAMPDMITFTHDGNKVLTANEGQPKSDYTIDPEGSVSIIDISGGVANLTQSNVSTADFQAFNAQAATLKAAGVRIFGPNATVAQDMEPEYITIAADNSKAWVTCQENNAIAVIDLATSTITDVLPLGTKDHSLTNNALDVNDQSDSIALANWPIKGLYMPDAIASYSVNGQTYLVTANEGDAREYNAYAEVVRLGAATYTLDPVAFPNAAFLKANLGRLNVTTASGDTDGDGDFDEIHAFGSRSFSIWNGTTGALVSDNGQDFELITAQHPQYHAVFNASNSNNTFKNRSDDKGPEPEGIAVAKIGDKHYAFIALERTGGCMAYDITNPAAPVFVDYKNTRNLATYGGDNGAEGIIYIDSVSSPTGKPYVILANEVSSSLSIYEVKPFLPTTTGSVAAATFCYAFPNPATAEVNLLVEGAVKNATIQVMDITGKVILEDHMNGNLKTLNLQSVPAGAYFIQYKDAQRSGTVKVQKL